MKLLLTKELAELTEAGDELYIIDLQAAGEAPAAPFRASWWTVNPGSATEAERHDEHEIWIISTGTGSFTCGDTTMQVSSGDIVRIMPNTLHRIENNQSELLTVYSFWWK
jgi:mannose-6-phosphate isomerase-like protein (cupin superfamily)